MKKHYLFLFALAALMFTSCANMRIEKRHYRSGFYVDFTKHHTESAEAVNDIPPASEPGPAPAQPGEQDAVVTPAPVNPPVEKTVENMPRKNSQPPAVAPTSTEEPGQVVRPASHTDHEKPEKQEQSKPVDADVLLVLEIILAFLLPPLAIYLKEGATKRFWIDLVCFLFVIAWFSPFAYGGALHLFSIIFALLIVLDVI